MSTSIHFANRVQANEFLMEYLLNEPQMSCTCDMNEGEFKPCRGCISEALYAEYEGKAS